MSIGPIEVPDTSSGGRSKEHNVYFEVAGQSDISGKIVLTNMGFTGQQQLNDMVQYLVNMLAADSTFENVGGQVLHDAYQTVTPDPVE